MDYMLSVLRTENKTLGQPEKILGATLGLAGECGEVVDIIKKVQFHGHDLDINKLKLELGDVFYYLYSLCHLHNLTVEEVLDANVKKLEKRYPNGFSVNDSKRRDGLIDLYNCKVGDTVTRRNGTAVEVMTLDISNTSDFDVFINGFSYLRNGRYFNDRAPCDRDIVQHTPMGGRAVEVSEDVDVKPDGSYWDIRAPFVHYTPPIEVSKDAGVKHDETKTDLSLLTFSMLEPAARAFMHGEGKYGRGNFRNGFVNTRLLAAAMRHLMQFNSGEDNDSESGISHLGHALAAIMMLLDNQKEGKSTEGRYK